MPEFEIFEKCYVNGTYQTDFYRFLKNSCDSPVESFANYLDYSPLNSRDIRWNFEKFLLNRDGKVVMRIQHKVEPREIAPFIELLLNGGSLSDLKHLSAEISN